MLTDLLSTLDPAAIQPPRTGGRVAAAVSPLLIRDTEAAVICGISRATLHRRRAAGQFPPGLKIGRCLRWRVADLESFVACNCDIVRGRECRRWADGRPALCDL